LDRILIALQTDSSSDAERAIESVLIRSHDVAHLRLLAESLLQIGCDISAPLHPRASTHGLHSRISSVAVPFNMGPRYFCLPVSAMYAVDHEQLPLRLKKTQARK
jgi:hypothetical protein